MKIQRLVEIINGELLTAKGANSEDIKLACGCDLMSDVLSFIKADSTVLLTGLTAPQVIYTSEAADIKAICFVRGKIPGMDIVELANERGIILISTDLPMFEACGRLYKSGLKGCSERGE